MGFKVKKTKKQRIVGAIMTLIFLFILFCVGYFMTFFFSLSSTSHEGEKLVESDWKVVITDGYGYNAPQGVIFTFDGDGKFSIKYEDGTKIANGFYKLKIEDSVDEGLPATGVIKLLTLPFGQNFPEEWDLSGLRNDIDIRFIFTQTDNSGTTIYKNSDRSVASDTIEFQTSGTIFKVVRDGSDEAKEVKTSTGASASSDEE